MPNMAMPRLADAARTKARAVFEEKLANQPENSAWATELADIYQEAGRTREAVPYLARVSAADPRNTRLSRKVAALHAWFGQKPELAATRQSVLAFAKGTHDADTAGRAALVSAWCGPPTRRNSTRRSTWLAVR